MSFFSLETIQVFAESIGISSLKEDVSVTIAQEVEYRVRELIQDASKFMIHSHHSKLTCDDLNNALRQKHSEPLYGFDPGEPLNFRLIPHTNLFFTPDPEIDLDLLLNSQLPKAPLAAHFTPHWLAIEGVQPMIPENPPPPPPHPSVASSIGITSMDTKDQTDKAVLVTAKKDIGLMQEDADVTPCVKHVLSKEMQLFYDTVINCINSPKEEERVCAFESLRVDAGLQQLLPYFVQYVSEMIARNLKNPNVLLLMLEMCNCLVGNSHLFIEPYLHQLMPIVLSCVVGKTVGIGGSFDQQIRIRQNASQIVVFIERKFASAYQSLQLKTCKTLTRTLGESGMPLISHYGAFYCLSELGRESVEIFILPLLSEYVKGLDYENRFESENASLQQRQQQSQQQSQQQNQQQRQEIEAVWKLLMTICNRYLNSDDCLESNRQLIEQVFGDELLLMDVS